MITEPMPSMPIFFWGDEDGSRLRESYFDLYPGVWRHGDWIEITSRGTAIIYGRSDSTINRGGVRMGTSEIYSAVLALDEVVDALVIDLPREGTDGWMPLFVVLREGESLDDALIAEIRRRVREDCSPRHVPDEIRQIAEVPRTLSGKVLEVPVKRILMGTPADQAASRESLANPEALDYFIGLPPSRGAKPAPPGSVMDMWCIWPTYPSRSRSWTKRLSDVSLHWRGVSGAMSRASSCWTSGSARRDWLSGPQGPPDRDPHRRLRRRPRPHERPRPRLRRAPGLRPRRGPQPRIGRLAVGHRPRWRTPFEVTTPTVRRRPGISTHRAKLHRRDIRRHDGIRVTSPARTILDISPRLTDKALTRAVNDLRIAGHLRPSHLMDLLQRHPTHHGAPRLRALIDPQTGPTRSELEDAFQDLTDRFGLPPALINARVAGYEVDVLFPEEKVIVELDGYEFHRTRASFEGDRERDATTLQHGYVTVRMTWQRVKSTPEREAVRLQQILAARRRAA